jgi:hypothetical protein
MHPHHHDHDDTKLPTIGQQVNALIGASQIISSPVEMACRKPGTLGEKVTGSGKCALGVFLAPIVVLMIGGPEDTYVAGGTLVFGILAAAIHKQERRKLEKQGVRIHSQDVGVSRFKSLNAEPPVIILGGLLLSPFSVGLAAYLMIAGVALGISNSALKAQIAANLRARKDAKLENEYYARLEREDQ